jgi:hypothetical protein
MSELTRGQSIMKALFVTNVRSGYFPAHMRQIN